jgi:type I restriction enzyme S subunit
MTGQQLKNSILQMAIQGKLVPQDPHDEPASVLLERIREEKKRLVKEGKIKKKDLEEIPISEEEKPFDIQESWVWCRIGDIFSHTSGKQQSSSNKGRGTPQKFITTSNLYWGRFVLDNVKEMNFTEEEIKTCSATKGDLLVCEGGAGYGRSAIWDKDYDICLQNHVHRLRPCVDGICEYVYYLIYLLKESNQLESVGTAMPGLSANRLKSLVLPLPPLSEQHRIVEKLESLMPLIESFGKSQEALNALNASLPEKLRQSILQEAIQGHLVLQDPNEEPASVLLERIRAEKARLVKEGKLKKKDLEEKPISPDEIPFDIPEGWEWCRIESISYPVGSKENQIPTKDILQKGKIPVVSQGQNLIDGFSDDISKVISDIPVIMFGDHTRNVKYIDFNFVIGADGTKFFKPILIDARFFYYLITHFASKLRDRGYARHYTLLKVVLLPLPPLSEQRRIVTKLEELLQEIDKLKA